jgi:phosphohistidine phosphatase
MVFMEVERRLIVMRHAKAGELPGGPDFERGLKSRGRRDSAAAGEWLRDSGYLPDVVICSAARRTQQTWQRVAEVLGGTPDVSIDTRLYSAGAEDVLAIVGETPAEAGTLLYVGHNPAAAELVAILTGTEPHFPTAAIAVIEVPASWDELAAGDGDLAASWIPEHARHDLRS